MNASTSQRIFISYRRSDCQAQANAVYSGLKHHMPEATVFMDIDSIPPGADFEEHIRGEIEGCDVALIMIGDDWLKARPGSSIRRLDEVNDFVRLEVESALAAPHVRVIPLLVEGADMPLPDELPPGIQRLSRLNAFELADHRWPSDMTRLTDQLRQLAPDAAPAFTHRAEPSSPQPVTATEFPVQRLGHPQPLDTPASTELFPIKGMGPSVAFMPPPPSKSIAGLVLVSLLPMGLASWVVPMRLAARRPYESAFKARMKKATIALAAAAVVAVVCFGAAPTDSEGTATGPLPTIGILLMLGAMIGGVVLAVTQGSGKEVLPGTEAMLARRAQREKYRKLVAQDRTLAASMHIGRPDMSRDYDDGGLLDVNNLAQDVLAQHAGITREEAARIVEVRRQIGRFGDINEILAYVSLSESSVLRLKDVAVFI